LATVQHTTLLSGADLARAIGELSRRVAEGRFDAAPLALVGVRTRGVPLAHRIALCLRERHQVDAIVGAIDITLYRDDLSGKCHWPVLHGTELSFAVDAAEIVLVDDVLFTGRTVRAAMDELCDLGRPAAIRLAVLVDRGHRELPIQADYVALRVPTQRDDRIEVRLHEVDGFDEVRKC
jgi:pyrimidine operon attenuation protein/uracil phosphoribosyltransferase